MAGPTILQSDLVIYVILPFLLVFTLIFAILQKTEILGKGKKQIDAIVALVVGLIVISVANAVGVIVNLVPILGVGVVVILVFLILWGAFYEQDKFKVHDAVKYTALGISAVVVLIALLYYTPAWGWLKNAFTGSGSASLITNVIVIVVVIGAICIVLFGGGGKGKEEKKEP